MHDVQAALVSNGDGLAVRRVQHIPDEFLDDLKSERLASARLRTAEQHRVASIPVSVVEVWVRQGFDIYRAKPRDIIAKLQKDGLEAFITTTKTV